LPVATNGQLIAAGGKFFPLHMMVFVATLFVGMALFLAVFGPRPRMVGQLDIVYQGEIPPAPEELHFSAQFNNAYFRVFKGFVKPRVSEFWRSVTENSAGVITSLRRIYSGNGQTYVLYSVLLLITLAMLGYGG
jgi:hypothetical protein